MLEFFSCSFTPFPFDSIQMIRPCVLIFLSQHSCLPSFNETNIFAKRIYIRINSSFPKRLIFLLVFYFFYSLQLVKNECPTLDKLVVFRNVSCLYRVYNFIHMFDLLFHSNSQFLLNSGGLASCLSPLAEQYFQVCFVSVLCQYCRNSCAFSSPLPSSSSSCANVVLSLAV